MPRSTSSHPSVATARQSSRIRFVSTGQMRDITPIRGRLPRVAYNPQPLQAPLFLVEPENEETDIDEGEEDVGNLSGSMDAMILDDGVIDEGGADLMAVDSSVSRISQTLERQNGESAEELVAAILECTGRTLESYRYLEALATAPSSICTPTQHFATATATSTTSPHSPQAYLTDIPSSPPIHVPSCMNVLLGISIGRIRKSYIVTAAFESYFQLVPFLSYLKLSKPLLELMICEVENQNSSELLVGWGQAPLRVEEEGWDSQSTLWELCCLGDILTLEGGIGVDGTPECPFKLVETASIAYAHFKERHCLDSLLLLYAVYIFDPLMSCPHPSDTVNISSGSDMLARQSLVSVYLSRNHGHIYELVQPLLDNRHVYKTGYRHIWVHHYAMEVCANVGIVWDHYKRIQVAVITDQMQIHPNDVIQWLNLQKGTFRNFRTFYYHASHALSVLEKEENLDDERQTVLVILTHFLQKPMLIEGELTIPKFVFAAARRFSTGFIQSVCDGALNNTKLEVCCYIMGNV